MKHLLLALLSGILLAIAWPTYGISLFVFIAWVPLLLVEYQLRSTGKACKGKVFFLCYLSFLLWNTLTTWWIWNSTVVGALFALLVNSLLMSLVFLAYHLVAKRNTAKVSSIFLVAIWIAFEKFHHHWDFSWPWLSLGNVFSENIYLHHSVYTDNKFLPDNFIADLETETDNYLRAIKTLGRFGSAGDTLFRNLHHMEQSRIEKIIEGKWNRFTGFDFGFEHSYNAIVRMVIDEELNDLYIYEEFYDNHLTDPEMMEMEIMHKMIEEGEVIYADSSEPKAITFYNMNGLLINSVKKTTDMSKAGVRKIQSFRNIFIDKNVCPNTYRELTEMKWFYNKDGLIAKNPKTKKPFNIDPHTFDAIKYGISEYTPYTSNKHYYKNKEVDNET